MNHAILLVLCIPLITGILSLFFWGKCRIQRGLFVLSTALLLLSACYMLYAVNQTGFLVIQSANWEAPFGITLVADLLSAIMVLLTAIIAFATSIYSLNEIDTQRVKFGFYPVMSFMIFSVCGAFLTGDIFNLFVWFEIMLISSFVLMALGNGKAQLEASIKYVTINIVSSTFFLAGIGVIYGLTGTLNMADISQRLPAVPHTGLLDLAAIFFFIAFGVKAAIFPLYNWLPASYHTPPISVSAFFAGMLTKVGVYAFFRTFTLMFNHDSVFIDQLLWVIAATTMFFGVLGAAAQMDFRKVLSFHIISQIGYMMMGLAIGTKVALAGGVFYIMHHIIVKSNLFLVSGIVKQRQGSYDLKKLGGVFKLYPVVSLCFLISAFSLAGFPPLSGFWAKFIVIKGGLSAEYYVMVIVALIVGLLTLYSMTKIWHEAFWKQQPERLESSELTDAEKKQRTSQASSAADKGMFIRMAPVLLLSSITLCIGLFGEPIYQLAENTAEQLLNPARYVEAVLFPNKPQ